ncbi:uncharacterized protein Z518_07577 [Rhinocladiella mackenziei CBS 650.93]|uniref:Rhinocladiella mackenziei CBS 650.93 unplaced genomic scaffold supercont1.5, whole genome shotgun sequence n=1 Tax=Rhinocladiella mackenziei CBS 650.93 TaxID=1442369 RepID=A0A0D2IDZ3_9EURO|nr:uncharacterized protein Z518_07577 [Rhinocladiella mackenziei CBS 650.93]KIX04024.1 hypothetical protein Z518_07577 [Rhinocladiella mackenziei CBS 650.93]
MGVKPPFIYDRPSTYTFSGPTDQGFSPKAVTQASWTPRPSKPKQNGPLIDFNRHPDSYVVVPYGNLSAKSLNPNTKKRITRARQIQLFLRACALLGAVGILFCVIAINKTSAAVGWIIRLAPSVALCHTVYGIYHLCRAATGRTPASTASYMIFAALMDSGLIPFFVFSAWMANADYTNNTYGWSTRFNDSELSYKIICAFFLLSCIEGGLLVVSLTMDIYLGLKFKQIARLPPDMNPLEPTLTSRRKRNKSEPITEKNMQASALAAKRDSQASEFKRISFIHTRTDSADSVTLYGNDSARNSRAEFRKELDENGKDPWRWTNSSSPERPRSAVSPSPTSRGAGIGLDSRPERSSGLAKETSRPSSWLSYLDYEGVPSSMSGEATAELDQEVRPLSPVSAISTPDASFDKVQRERENWYQGAARNSQIHLPATNSPTYLHPNSASKTNLSPGFFAPAPERQLKKRSREPLAMNPPTPTRTPYQDENSSCTPLKEAGVSHNVDRAVLHDADGNAQARPKAGFRPSNFIDRGGKAQFYGDLRSSIGSTNSHNDKKEMEVANKEVEDPYERTRTLQTENDYSANFEVYGSDSEDERLRANVVQAQPLSARKEWNGVRQVSNSTGYDLHGGYAELGSEFGKGMGRRRDVSGKVVEEGRASPPKNGPAGRERSKGL